MRRLKDWYTYNRQGVIYVQFKDKVTGKKLTAKSTRTRDTEEAAQVINMLYYNPESYFNKSQWELHKDMFAPMIQASVTEAVESAIKSLPMILNPENNQTQNNGGTTQTSIYPAEIRPIAEKLDTITLYEYLLLYWDYEQSPYIKQQTRLGKEIPNPERFKRMTGILKCYKRFFNETKLTEITADEINTILGFIKNKKNHKKLTDSTMCSVRYIFTQALNFAYRNNLIPRDICYGITRFSGKNKEREIFTKEETQKIFNGNTDPFNRLDCFLINKLLFVTGCRIGEIVALQPKDIIKTARGYMLNISKSYNYESKRIKETKTERSDYVYISDTMAAELLDYIKTNPFKRNDAFIFYSNKSDRPIHYDAIQRNFQRTMKKLGIKRKNLTLHSYRHTYAVFLSMAGYSQAELKYMTRHDSLKELQRYMSHITPELELKNIEAAHLFQKLIA